MERNIDKWAELGRERMRTTNGRRDLSVMEVYELCDIIQAGDPFTALSKAFMLGVETGGRIAEDAARKSTNGAGLA